jgi:hypothetical protein
MRHFWRLCSLARARVRECEPKNVSFPSGCGEEGLNNPRIAVECCFAGGLRPREEYIPL